MRELLDILEQVVQDHASAVSTAQWEADESLDLWDGGVPMN